MGTLSFTATISLDGYAADPEGSLDWSVPDADVFQFHVDRMGAVSTEVLGRRTAELMTYWDSVPDDEEWTDAEHEFSRGWQSIDQIVASSTLTVETLPAPRARLVNDLTLDVLEQIVHDAAGEVEIFGPTTAAPAILAGMVTDFRFFIVPLALGGGLRALPSGVHIDAELVENRVFGNGVAFLHYRSSAQRARS